MPKPSRFAALIAAVVLAPECVNSQTTDSARLPDCSSHSKPYGDSSDSPSNRRVSWGSLPKAFLHDQKGIWLLFPAQLAHGHYWLPTLAIAGGTAGLIVADPHVMSYFRTHARNLDDVNDTFDAPITTAEVILLPGSLLIAGYARHDLYQVDTALLAGEAYADSAVVDLAIKAITRRKRPSDVPPGAPFNALSSAAGNRPSRDPDTPPALFAVATVVATRYHTHRWVPWAVYGFATAVSFSRITGESHFPSDVFLGAALGYTISRYQVLRPR